MRSDHQQSLTLADLQWFAGFGLSRCAWRRLRLRLAAVSDHSSCKQQRHKRRYLSAHCRRSSSKAVADYKLDSLLKQFAGVRRAIIQGDLVFRVLQQSIASLTSFSLCGARTNRL